MEKETSKQIFPMRFVSEKINRKILRIFLETTAAILIITGVFILIKWNFLSMNFSAKDNCSGLLSGGKRVTSTFSFGQTWQPRGCLLKERSTEETVTCLRELQQRHDRVPTIALVGDSRIRQLRDGILHHLTGKDLDFLANENVTINPKLYGMKHLNGELVLKNQSLRIEYIWATDLDQGMGTIGKFLNRTIHENHSTKRPTLTIIGSGIWAIMRCNRPRVTIKEDCVEQYQRNFTKLLPLMSKVAENSPVLWVPQNWIYESRNRKYLREMGFNNTISGIYNDAIRNVFRNFSEISKISNFSKFSKFSRVIFWESFFDTSRQFNGSLDGVHLSTRAKYFDVQMIFNLLCNPLLESKSWLEDFFGFGFCCAPTENSSIPAEFFPISSLFLFYVFFRFYYRFRTEFNKFQN